MIRCRRKQSNMRNLKPTLMFIIFLICSLLFITACSSSLTVTCRNYTGYTGPVFVTLNEHKTKTATLNGLGSISTVRFRPILSPKQQVIFVKSLDGAHGTLYLKDSKTPKYIMAVRDANRQSGFGFLVSEMPLRF